MEIQTVPPVLASIQGTQKALGDVGRNTIYNLINAGQLETVKLGRRTLVTVESIRRVAEAA